MSSLTYTSSVSVDGLDCSAIRASTAIEAIDKLHYTAKSHERGIAVEVMGHKAGWIALNKGPGHQLWRLACKLQEPFWQPDRNCCLSYSLSGHLQTQSPQTQTFQTH